MDKFIPHGDPQREQNLADWHYKSHPATKNPDGSPRVFYHGTKDNSMINFSAPNEPIGRRKIEKDDGAFFTDDPSVASLYAGDNVGHIFPVYLSLPENELSTFDLYTKKGINHVYDTLKKSRVELPYDGDRKSFVEYYHNYASPIKLRDDFAEHWAQYSPYPIRFLMGKNESHYQVFNVNQIKSATGNRGTFDPSNPDITKGDGGEVDGITAYHGSPHEFEQFDTSKIGTGEGAQAYGHGLYFAEAEPVAKEYRDALQNPTISVKGKEFPLASQAANKIYPYEDLSYPENINWSEVLYPIHHALTKMQNYEMDLDAAIDDMRSNYSHYKPEYVEKAEQLIRSVKPEIKNKGHMYEVHIDAHPDHFLDWDKPLSEQSEHVKNALANHTPLQKNRPYKPEDTGRDVYYKNTQGLGQKIASNELMSLGIRGIKYLDAGSRGPLASWSTDKLTHNYVVFDHDRVNIKRRYAEGGEVEAYRDGGEVDRESNLAAFLAGNHPKVPRVLYHGTNKDFSIHDPEMLGSDEKTSHQTSQLGHWFTGNPAQASEYAIWKTGRGANVQPVHISLKKPAILDWDDIQEKDGWDLQQKLIRKGHDGAIVHSNGPNLNYVVFTPHQIKSATGNQGTFDPKDPDITKNEGGGVDRTKMSYKDVTQRVPELKEAAFKLGTDEMTPEMYQDLVNKHKPVQAWDHVPAPATQEEIYNALDANKRRNVGKGHLIPEGYPVGLRLDIPAYTNHGVWVPTIHDRAGSKPTVLAHEPAAHITDAKFNILPNTTDVLKALKIAQGGTKNPFATINGSWNPTHPDDIHAMAQQYLNHPDWAQVGMDPERHSYFYDRRTQQPITHASEVLQVGPLVLAHKPVYGNKEDYPFKDGGDVERDHFGFGGDTVGAGSRPERGATGSAVAAREAPQPSYRDMPAELQQAQRDLSFKNERVINAMKEANAADKQQKAEQMTAWAGAGFPAGGPASMQVGEETRPTAYAMSDISKKSPVMQPQADIIASLAPPPQHYESSIAGNQIAAAPIPQRFEPTIAQNQIAAAPMPQHYEPTFAQNQIAPAPQQVAFKQPARPISPTPVNKPIQLASLDSSTFKPASPMPDFQPQQPQGSKGGRRLVRKLMPDGTYQDVWEEYAHGGVAKYHSNHHNPAIVEYALNKISAPPPALDPTLMVAKRGRPF